MPRAICEVCSHPQPVDWKPGDLCIECGQAVRHEVRCFWCAKWTPAGKFCRRCGAAVLEESLYGAARMLREAGTDRFRIPKLIGELDPDQVDNFTRIYQRHAVVLNRHVDHVRFLENFLHQRHWSAALEEELVAELPWPDERLEKFSASMGPEVPTLPSGIRWENLATVKAIQAATPLGLTISLAVIVRMNLGDWSAQSEVASMLRATDIPLRSETALALSGWRALEGPVLDYGYPLLLQALRDCPLKLPAAVRLALMRVEGCELPAEAVASSDPEIRFMAALAAGDGDVLRAALRSDDELERATAAKRLIELEDVSSLSDVVAGASADRQVAILRGLVRRGQPAPVLREALYTVARNSESREARRAAIRVLCWGCPPDEVERLADAAFGDPSSYQAILQQAGLPPEALARFGDWMLEHQVFRADQFGMKDIAKADRMPADFVPRRWNAADPEVQKELCGFAEFQLNEYGDEDLHRFLVGVAFRPGDVKVRSTVFNAIYRWYRWNDSSGATPIAIRKDAIRRFFGTIPDFLSIYTRFLKDPSLPDLLKQAILADPVRGFLRYASDDVLPEFAAQPSAVSKLADAVGDIAYHRERFEFDLRTECIAFLGWLAQVPEFRKKMRARVVAFQGTELDHASKMALERLNATHAGA
ncbi:MAG TPA: hypothetical protein VKU19_03870 [Bryobacteraceae bacterium]|nr:hypothetical protein [Bryobacteraceae bacterium]